MKIDCSLNNLLLTLALILLPAVVTASDHLEYTLRYHVALHPDSDSATVNIELDNHDGLVKEVDFNLDKVLHSELEADGELTLTDGRAQWVPPKDEASLTLTARITQQRDKNEFDALMTEDWAIFRGDDLVPPARVTTTSGAESRAQLSFTLPDHWTSVTTGWEKLNDRTFRIENPERRFSRPTGWMIAGRLGTRVERFDDSFVAVSAPRDSSLRRMDVLTYVTLLWPQMEAAFGTAAMPPVLAIIGHGDPMWRGGLSGPNSLFLHAERPLVSENGTSALAHELFHVVTRIDSRNGHDWIVEGLAEFYSFELLHRAGAQTDRRRQRVLNGLAEWSADVTSLITENSSGVITARAVILFETLDQEIRRRSNGDHSLDDVVKALIPIRQVTLEDLKTVTAELIGGPAESLDSPLLAKD